MNLDRVTGTFTGPRAHPMASDHGIRLLDRRWTQAENRVYPLVLSEPQAYQRAVTVIRAIADRLRSVTTLADLADTFGQAEALAVSAAGESGTPIADLHAGALAGAGLRFAVPGDPGRITARGRW